MTHKETSMPTVTDKTVAQIALENPSAAREFEKLGIDYCCGGKRSLEDACAAANVPVDEVLKHLDAASPASKDAPDFEAMSLADLIVHITSTHHVFVRTECPRIQELANKVATKHAEKHSELLQVQEIFTVLAGELSVHLMKEEQILFPYIVRMDEAQA